MSHYRTFLITSLLLYSSASFANEENTLTKDPELAPYSYQTELNEYSFASNVNIGPSDPLFCSHQTLQNDENQPLVFLGNHFSLTMDQLSNPHSGACIYSPNSIHLQEFAFLTLSQCTNISSEQDSSHSGMLCSDQSIIFDKNISTIFYKNTASGCGGALKAKEIAFNNTTSTISFSENEAHENGGALCGDKISLSTQRCLSLNNNQAKQSGGALYAAASEATPLSNQPQDRCTIEYAYQANLMSNQALNGNGGAIYSTDNHTLQGIIYLRAQNNRASSSQDTLGNGGVIYNSNINSNIDSQQETIPSELHIKNNSIAAFTDNSASQYGGAIYGDQINIDQNMGVYFFRNQAKQGGAIAVSNIGSLSLQSESGVIIFQDNKAMLDHDSYVHNAIHLAPKAHFSQISTKANGGVFFYDPIVQDPLPADETPQTLIINAKTESPSGAVVFSGKHISKEAKRFQENITSTLHHHVILDSGDLYLEEGAHLKVQSFEQSKESKLHLQPGTLLSTQEGLHVTNLEIPLHLINNQDVAYLATTSLHDAPLSVEGSLSLIDTEKAFYENHALLNYEENWIPLIEACSACQIDNLPINVEGDLSSPYGYQGSWNIEWQDTDQPDTKQLCAHWRKSAYTPNPERITELVANSLWNTRADLFAIHELLETKTLAEPYSLGVWGAATSSFFHKTIDKQLPVDRSAWKHRSCGYMVGINSHSLSDHVFGFAAGQLYGRSEDHLITEEQRRSYIISAFTKLSTPILTLSANAAYNKTYHTISTHYQAFQDEGSGCWESQSFSGDISSEIVLKLRENSRLFHSLSFFAKARLFDGTQPTFDETNKEARTFSNNYLRVLSTPCGVSFESKTKRHGMYYNASLAYSQDIYRENSIPTITLLANQESWSTEMADFDKHAFLFQLSHHRTFKYLQLFANFSGEIRKNSQIYSLNLGSTCKF